MKLIAFDMPDSPGEIALWLENIICQGDLRGLISQLSAVHAESESKDFEHWIGGDRQALLAGGLQSLEFSRVQELLLYPALLLELQEAAMMEGGSYWQERFEAATLPSSTSVVVDQTKAHLNEQLGVGSTTVLPSSRSSMPRMAIAVVVLAACLALGVFGVTRFVNPPGDQPQIAKWGWSADDAFPADLSSQDYFARLEGGAQAWFKKRPADLAALKKRLIEYRTGCETLLAMRHEPLSAADRTWLLDKCRRWKKRIEDQLAAIDGAEFETALEIADRIAGDMVKALKERSAQLAVSVTWRRRLRAASRNTHRLDGSVVSIS